MENRIAKLVKYSFGPRSCLAASLAEFELFIHELCWFALPAYTPWQNVMNAPSLQTLINTANTNTKN